MDYGANVQLKETRERDAARLSSDRHAAAALTLLNKVDRKTAVARRRRNMVAGWLALVAAGTAIATAVLTYGSLL